VATGVLKTMVLARLKSLAVTLLTLGAVTIAGIGHSLPNSIKPALFAMQTKETGVKKAHASGQAEPAILTLFGVTDYDPATVTTVLTQFDNCRVDKVLVDLGQTVKKGEPLLELFSTDLAAAKNDYQTASVQWQHDLRILNLRKELASTNAIAKQLLVDTQNDESKSRLKMKVARDRLLVYGLGEEEIKKVPGEDAFQKARMVLRSRGAGVIVKKTVVPGNFYAAGDEFMRIATLDHIWIRGNASEANVDKLEVGQTLTVIFPYSISEREVAAKLEFIDKRLDPETRTAKFLTTVPNPGERIKAGALVRIQVQLPRGPGTAVIPGGTRDRRR
jgi:membrane fusion protein, heavy metal efflux system